MEKTNNLLNNQTTQQKNICPKFDKCNAAVCPLDRLGKHLKDEPICFYAREIVKVGSAKRFQKHGFEWMYEAIGDNLDWYLKQSSDIRKRIELAVLTPSSMTSPQKN